MTQTPLSDGLPEGIIAVCAKCRQDVFVSANGWLRCGRCNKDYALTAIVASAVPTGWRLVPVEPTKEMFDAGVKAAHDGDGMSAKKFYPTVYKAMIAAAPEPDSNE